MVRTYNDVLALKNTLSTSNAIGTFPFLRFSLLRIGTLRSICQSIDFLFVPKNSRNNVRSALLTNKMHWFTFREGVVTKSALYENVPVLHAH